MFTVLVGLLLPKIQLINPQTILEQLPEYIIIEF